MKRKQIDKILAPHATYQNATESCRRHFVAHVKQGARLSGAVPMDTIVREAWIWFWLGWFRQ